MAEIAEKPLLGADNGCWAAGFGNTDYEASGKVSEVYSIHRMCPSHVESEIHIGSF